MQEPGISDRIGLDGRLPRELSGAIDGSLFWRLGKNAILQDPSKGGFLSEGPEQIKSFSQSFQGQR